MRALKIAWRRLTGAPLFTIFSIATLALGIGATTAVYSFLYATVWRRPALPDPDQIITIAQASTYERDFSLREFEAIAAERDAFASVGAFRRISGSLSGRGTARLVVGQAVTEGFFDVLRVAPLIGRTLHQPDHRPGAPAVVVIAESVWHAQFATDSTIVGQTVRLSGNSYEVIGVMPSAASTLSRYVRPEVWVSVQSLPVTAERLGERTRLRDSRWFDVIARLAPGQSVESARARLAPIVERFDERSRLDPERPEHRRRLVISPAFGESARSLGESDMGRLVLALPALVLLIACTNLTNLVLSRGAPRQQEFAVRRALGAPRWLLIREQLVEGGLIAVAGTLGGLLVASALITYVLAALERTFGALPQLRIDARLEPAVLAVTVGTGLLALTVSSLIPALQLTKRTRTTLHTQVSEGGLPRWRGRSNLIALQVAASVGLFLVAALFVRTAMTQPAGVETPRLDDVAMLSLPFAPQRADETHVRGMLAGIVARVRAASDVDAVGLRSIIGSPTSGYIASVTSLDRPFVDKVYEGQYARPTVATAELFKILGHELRTGRPFNDRDEAGSEPVVLINESLARTVFGTRDAAGRDLLISREVDGRGVVHRPPLIQRAQIVGVLADTLDAKRRPEPVVWFPFSQEFVWDVTLFAKSRSGNADGLTNVLRTAVRDVDPELAVLFAGPASTGLQRPEIAVFRLLRTGALALAALALILSMAGLYGVLSEVVARRTRELGVRMALGADARRIMKLIAKDGFRPVVEGAVIGLGSAALVRLSLQRYFEVRVTAVDLIALALAVGPLLIAAAGACWLPARRAARVDPNTALREL